MSYFPIVFSPRAKRDLEEIYAYTRNSWSKAQADSYLDKIEACIHQLAENPNLGRPRPEIRANYRSLTKESHTVFYKISTRDIHILGIVHNRMDITNRMF